MDPTIGSSPKLLGRRGSIAVDMPRVSCELLVDLILEQLGTSKSELKERH